MSKRIKSSTSKQQNNDQLASYGQDEHGALPREEREEIIISKIEEGAEVKDEMEENQERAFRDEIESEGSQDPYSQ
jgi:hypothetical protein